MGEGKPKRKRRRWIVAVLVLVLAGLLADYRLYPTLTGVGGTTKNRGENGLWLRYTWYFGEKTEREIQALAKSLRERKIRYAYFHVRSIERDGSLKFRFPERAQTLTRIVRDTNKDVRTFAWVYAGNPNGLGEVDLADVKVRRKMVTEARRLTTECGFDGIQWDYEICPDGDQNLLKLLDETRAALPKGKLLSVATAANYPAPLGGFGWSLDYFAKVAKQCDQIAVMCYDSGAYMPRWYVGFVKRQANLIPAAVRRANARCLVLLGLPTYGEGTASHNPKSENLRLALKAVREADGTPDGVALFADYTTDPDEWRTYDRLWPAAASR